MTTDLTSRAVLDDVSTGSWVHYEPGVVDGTTLAALEAEMEVRRADFELDTAGAVRAPRLVTAFGDAAFRYPDLGPSRPWPTHLGVLRQGLAAAAGHHFNYALVNWYRDGSDHTGWHADKMEMHVAGSNIAIVSIGAPRTLAIRRRTDHDDQVAVVLDAGSVLWMRGAAQAHYEHALPVCDEPGRRLSLSFRLILPEA